MPFTKITSGKNKGKSRSESGKLYTAKQMRLYYATKGFTQTPPKRKRRRKK